MARALIIGPEQESEIRNAVERARKRPIPWEVLRQSAVADPSSVLRLEDRGPEHKRPRAEMVLVPMGYRLNVSFEHQPAGLLAHFSISVERRNAMPSPESVRMMLEVAGFDLDKADHQWTEEFLIDDQPGGLAINLVFMVEPARVMGHA